MEKLSPSAVVLGAAVAVLKVALPLSFATVALIDIWLNGATSILMQVAIGIIGAVLSVRIALLTFRKVDEILMMSHTIGRHGVEKSDSIVTSRFNRGAESAAFMHLTSYSARTDVRPV